MDDLRAILFFAHGVVVMTQGLRIIGAGFIISLGLGCRSADKLEPLPLPVQLPSPELTAPEPGSPSPTTQSNGSRPSVSSPNPYPSVQTAEASPPGFENVPGSSIQVPNMTPAIPQNPAVFSRQLPVVPPVDNTTPISIDVPPQPPRNDFAGEMAADVNEIRLPRVVQELPYSDIRLPNQ